jgi:16S rRNA A1518/A1519 N6-dimethyltransferase RsmA/KsgA/DIM1 with predicted DNA glycosylase/AP lyase activity
MSVKAELERHGLRARRSLGQNFLADRGLCDKIAALVAPAPGSVLEIGAGLGALTAPLLARGTHVLAVETDRSLTALLREKFSGELAAGQLELLEADARELDLADLLGRLGRHVRWRATCRTISPASCCAERWIWWGCASAQSSCSSWRSSTACAPSPVLPTTAR